MSGIHRRVADVVFDRLHERIVTGSLRPGDRVDSSEVAAELGVSRTPVREAILRLEALGLVDRIAYTGVVVTAVDPDVAEDVTALRVHVETLAVRTAVPLLTVADLEQMGSLHERLEAAVAGAQAQQAFRDLNREFHMTLYRAAGSAGLERVLTDLSARAERLRLHFDVRHGRAVADHAAILAACEAGDVDAAVTATCDHIMGTFLMMVPDGFAVAPGSVLGQALATVGHHGRVLRR